MGTLVCESTVSAVSALLDRVDAHLRCAGAPDRTRRRLLLSLDEVAINAVEHGAPTSPILVRVRRIVGGFATIMAYAGPAFDPTGLCPFPLNVVAGGHGLGIVRAQASKFRYRRVGSANIVLMAHRDTAPVAVLRTAAQ